MAKKSKKEVEEVEAPEEVLEAEEAEEEAEEAPAPAKKVAKPKIQASRHPVVQKAMKNAVEGDPAFDLFEIVIDPPVKVNGEILEGRHVLPRHLYECVQHSIVSKRRADLESITGRSFLVEQIAGRLNVTDQGPVK